MPTLGKLYLIKAIFDYIKRYIFKRNKLEKLEKQLNSFLFNNSGDGLVLSIQGYWGIGKTHFWNNYIEKQECVNKFVNISLFGINSIDDIKKKILLKTSIRFKLNDKIQKYMGIDLASMISIISKNEFKEIIICFDDFERMSPNLNMTEILGFISELKEQHSCKMVLINNNNILEEQDKLNHKKIIKRTISQDDQKRLLSNQEELQLLNIFSENKKKKTMKKKDNEKFIITSTNNEEIFNTYIEKIVDITLWYEPTLQDIFKSIKNSNQDKKYIDFTLIENLFAQLHNNNKKFNRRLIRQVIIKLELLRQILEQDINVKIKNGIILNVFRLVVKENINYTILQIPLLLPFDKQIFINIVKKHQVDIKKFNIVIEEQNRYISSTEFNENLYEKIKNTYYRYLYELQYDDKIFAQDFFILLSTENVDVVMLVGLDTFSWYFKLIKKLNKKNQRIYQNKFIEKVKYYIEKNINNLMKMDSFRKDEIMKIIDSNKTLSKFYAQKKQKLEEGIAIDIDKIIQILNKLLNENVWSYQNEELLSSISKKQHKAWLILNREYFELIFKFITYVNSISGSSPLKNISNMIIEIYKELYNTKHYKNKMELIIRNFKIDIDDK